MKFFLYGLLLLSLATIRRSDEDVGSDEDAENDDSSAKIRNCSNVYNGTENDDDFKLLKVFCLCRHGERTPYFVCPKDSTKNDTYPGRLGILTEAGRNTSISVGEWIRNYYAPILRYACAYDKVGVLPISSVLDRTVQTINHILRGLCPDRVSITVRICITVNDNILSKLGRCPERDRLLIDYYSRNETQDVLDKYNETIKNCFENVCGVNISQFSNNYKLIQIIEAIRDGCFNQDIKHVNRTKEEDYCCQQFTNITKMTVYNKDGNNYTGGEKLQKINEGGILRIIKDFLLGNPVLYPESTMNTPTLMVAGGHDPSVASLMKTVGADDERKNSSTNVIPDYNSCVCFELYQSKNDSRNHTVGIIYKRPEDNSPIRVRMDPCCNATKCPLNFFLDIIKKYSESDYDALCGNNCTTPYPCFA